MNFFYVYLIISKRKNKYITYVGYTNNINNRLKLHNTSKGAKFTKGGVWFLAYLAKYLSKKKKEFCVKRVYNEDTYLLYSKGKILIFCVIDHTTATREAIEIAR